MSKTETQTASEKPVPSHIAYQVSVRGKDSYWTRIGAVWTHKDGKGFSIQLSGLPLDGRILLRIASEE